MSLHRKKWSKKDKEEVLLYNDQHGVSQTSREFNISSATIYNWKKKYDELGTVGLEAGSKTPHSSSFATRTTLICVYNEINKYSVLS